MKKIRIVNQSRSLDRQLRVGFAVTFFEKLRGLMFRKSIGAEEGMLLVQDRDSVLDSAIHMMFVPFDLAIIWINNRMQVVDVQLARSWRPAYWSRLPARYVLELHPERLDDFRVGEQVKFDEIAA